MRDVSYWEGLSRRVTLFSSLSVVGYLAVRGQQLPLIEGWFAQLLMYAPAAPVLIYVMSLMVLYVFAALSYVLGLKPDTVFIGRTDGPTADITTAAWARSLLIHLGMTYGCFFLVFSMMPSAAAAMTVGISAFVGWFMLIGVTLVQVRSRSELASTTEQQ